MFEQQCSEEKMDWMDEELTILVFQSVAVASMAAVLGVPAALDPGCLPTEAAVYNLHVKLLEDGITSGKWKNGSVSLPEVARETYEEVEK